jgi:hypothetical protein
MAPAKSRNADAYKGKFISYGCAVTKEIPKLRQISREKKALSQSNVCEDKKVGG